MTRILCVMSLILVVTVYTRLAAQDDTKSGRPAVVDPNAIDPSTVPSDGPPDNGKATLEEIVNDKAIEPVAQTVSAVKQALQRTGRITIRYGGQQVTMPVVEEVPAARIAAAILDHSQGLPETTLNIGKKSLLFTAAPDTARTVAEVLVNLMFVEPRELELKTHPKREIPISADATIHSSDGAEAVPLEANDESIERVLRGARDISIMLYTYNILIPLSDKSPHAELARAIRQVVKQDPSIRMLDGRKSLLLVPPVASIQKVFHAIAVVLMPPASAQGKDDRVEGAAANSLPAVPALPDEEYEVRVFALKHAQADVLEKIFRQLFREDVVARADARTNSIILRGPGKLLDEVKALIIKMDQPGPQTNDAVVEPQHVGQIRGYVEGNLVAIPESAPNAPGAAGKPPLLSDLKLRYADLERMAAMSAKTIPNEVNPDPKRRSQLRRVVTEMFALRQQIHQAELAAFQQRMEKVRQTIQARENVKDKIIERHVEDLLNPGLKWESKPETGLEQAARIDWIKLERKLGILFPNSKVKLVPMSNKILIKGQARDSEEAGWIVQIVRGEIINELGDLGGPQNAVEVLKSANQGNNRYGKSANGQDSTDRVPTWIVNMLTIAIPKPESRPESAPAATNEPTELEGEWNLVSIMGGGVIGHEQELKLRIEKNQWVMSRGTHDSHYTITVNPGTDPKSIDLVAVRNDELPRYSAKGIYQLDGDTLTVAWSSNLAERPASLEGANLRLHTWKRAGTQNEFLQLNFTGPKGAAIATLDQNGFVVFGGKTEFHLPSRRRFVAAKAHRLLLSQIPNHAGLELFLALDILPITDKSRDFMNLNQIQLQVTDEEIQQAANGNVILKVIYLKTPAVAGTPYTVETMVSSRTDPKVDPIGEARKLGTVLAVMGVQKMKAATEPPPARTEYGPPSSKLPGGSTPGKTGVEKGLPESDVIGIFDPLLAAPNTVTVGVVSKVSETGVLVISLAEPGTAKVGDVWDASRKEAFDPTNGRRFARVKVIEAQKETAYARMIETSRVRRGNEFVYDTVQVGDELGRRPHGTPFPEPEPEDQSNTRKPQDKAAANLRAIMLALHHYHDQHRHFPPATIMGKDGKGKVPHSWRVEILPQLGEQKLYDEYRFDEPWDSDHNKSLLLKMPPVFRSPLDNPDSPFASYFALVTPDYKPQSGGVPAAGAAGNVADMALAGPRYDLGTVFSNPLGTKFLDIHDGTANTVTLVEAKRAIPWTKPEDITYSALQPVPVLGGWFPAGWHAGFAEGTVKLISPDNPDAILRALFTIGGGENVKPKTVDDNPQGTRR